MPSSRRTRRGYVFPNTIGGALDLTNLADRIIIPMLKVSGIEWKGWHGFRRGLASNLKALGVDDVIIRDILRHKDVSTTQRNYIKIVPDHLKLAMDKLSDCYRTTVERQRKTA